MCLRIATALYAAGMLYPFFALIWHGQDTLPVPVYAWMMVWHLLLMGLGVAGVAIWVAWLAGRAIRPRLRRVAGETHGASATNAADAGVREAAGPFAPVDEPAPKNAADAGACEAADPEPPGTVSPRGPVACGGIDTALNGPPSVRSGVTAATAHSQATDRAAVLVAAGVRDAQDEPGQVSLSAATGADAADPPADLWSSGQSRRTFLATAVGLVPVLVVGGAVAGGLRQQGRFRIRRIHMSLPRLPEPLRGLTITHVSDIHVGRLFRPEHLPALVDAVNALDSDLVAFTGDAVDHSFDYMPAACEALRQMRSRYGGFSVIGNHDLIDSPSESLACMRRYAPNFLEDSCTQIDIGGQQVRIGGLSWRRYDRMQRNPPWYDDRVRRMLTGADEDIFTIALTHHPHAFDALAAAGVDLTLAGHTHGGQIMLTPPGSAHPIGGGSLLFRYIWGEYRQGHSALYVTSGVGNWFPVRINAPAEIVQIRLARGGEGGDKSAES